MRFAEVKEYLYQDGSLRDVYVLKTSGRELNAFLEYVRPMILEEGFHVAGDIAGVYQIAPLLVFDFGISAVPFDEGNHAGHSVVIGPRPRPWVPFATHSVDYPGGADYRPASWPFQVWKPICIAYARYGGHELPAVWR